MLAFRLWRHGSVGVDDHIQGGGKAMTEEYTPFGEEWEKEMMQFTKKELVKMLRTAFENSIEKAK